MTCIVGLVDNNNIYIGGDSAGVAYHSIDIRGDEKVFIKDRFIFGFTTSFRMGQLIRYKLSIPKIKEDQDIDDYLYTDFIDSIIKCFKDNLYAYINNNEIYGGEFLFGFRGKLYHVDNDFQIGKVTGSYDCVGSGHDLAKGAMFVLDHIDNFSNEEKIELALSAAQLHNTCVRGPFHILKLEY